MSASVLLPEDAFRPHTAQPGGPRGAGHAGRRGVRAPTASAAVQQVADRFGAPDVQTADEYTESVAGEVDMMLNVVYVLLALAIVIALMGIANTLSLSIHERTRELGLLRAVGQSRRQLRSMVRGEALTVALFGTAGGVGLGLFLGWAMVEALADEGFTTSPCRSRRWRSCWSSARPGRGAGGGPPRPPGRPHGRAGGDRHGLTCGLRHPPAPPSTPPGRGRRPARGSARQWVPFAGGRGNWFHMRNPRLILPWLKPIASPPPVPDGPGRLRLPAAAAPAAGAAADRSAAEAAPAEAAAAARRRRGGGAQWSRRSR